MKNGPFVPSITVDKFNGTADLEFTDHCFIHLQKHGAGKEVIISAGIKTILPNNSNIIQQTYAPQNLYISHSAMDDRDVCTARILNYMRECFCANIEATCPGIRILIYRLLEEYYNGMEIWKEKDNG